MVVMVRWKVLRRMHMLLSNSSSAQLYDEVRFIPWILVKAIIYKSFTTTVLDLLRCLQVTATRVTSALSNRITIIDCPWVLVFFSSMTPF